MRRTKSAIFQLGPRVEGESIVSRSGEKFMSKLTVAAAMLCCVLATRTFAQTTNATAGGIVSDSSGAVIPGVMVTATNTQTGIVSTLLTNESGAYQFASLQPGSYKFSAELPGFQ